MKCITIPLSIWSLKQNMLIVLILIFGFIRRPSFNMERIILWLVNLFLDLGVVFLYWVLLLILMGLVLCINGWRSRRLNGIELQRKNWLLRSKGARMGLQITTERKEARRVIKTLKKALMRWVKMTSTLISWQAMMIRRCMKVEDKVDLRVMEVKLDHKSDQIRLRKTSENKNIIDL